MPTKTIKLRLMTYNIGGGRKASFHEDPANLETIIKIIKEVAPDILAVQEATIRVDADGNPHSSAHAIAVGAGFGDSYAFGPTLSSREHMNINKKLFVEAIFHDEQEWTQGNALFTRRRFVRLGNPALEGKAANVPIFRPPTYEGNRDTDPRYALLARLDLAPLYPFVIGTHFTTLVNERTARDPEQIPASEQAFIQARYEEARMIRYRQAKMVVDLLRTHVLDTGQTAFLMGDFNALASELCIQDILVGEGGFLHLDPQNPDRSTHPKTTGAVDHIFVYPRQRLIDYRCRVVEFSGSEDASDHLPVVADVELELS